MTRLRTSLYCGETPRSMVSLTMPPPMLTRSWNSSMGDEAMMPGTCSMTAAISSRVMKSGVEVLSGPTTEPPLYCISIMLGPMDEMRLRAYCLPVSPRVTTKMMEAEPMIMPSMVRRKRTLLALKESMASLTTSLNIMVERALRRVASNVERRCFGAGFAAVSGLGRFTVAMWYCLMIRRLTVSQWCGSLRYSGGVRQEAAGLPQRAKYRNSSPFDFAQGQNDGGGEQAVVVGPVRRTALGQEDVGWTMGWG